MSTTLLNNNKNISIFHSNIILEILSELNNLLFEDIICQKFLLKLSIHFFIDKAAIYLKDYNEPSFYLVSKMGIINTKYQYSIKEKEIITMNNLKIPLIFNKIQKNQTIFEFFNESKKALILPLIFVDEMIGFVLITRNLDIDFLNEEINLIIACVDELSKSLNSIIFIRKNQISQAKLTESHEQLKSFETLKNSFIYNITHEFRTPLVTIKGYLDLLNEEDLGELNQQQKKALQIIIKNSNNLSYMIDNLLLFIQISDKIKNFNREKINICEFVKSIIKEYENINTPIILSTQSNEIFIKINPEFIRIAIKQLIDNAIKFNKDNKPIMISIEKDENYAYIFIIDKGIGMDEETINNIFKLFYQHSKDLSRKYGGLGFGLSLTKKILELHNFKLIIESKLNEGTKIGFKANISKD
ncbi:MAG: HAMP domain-containing histidine kinase [Spirochaetes bacterium]|nr:HAMP domain-containing histidine kinase [Spirochaetota bacterium]